VLGDDRAGEGQLSYHWEATAGPDITGIIYDTNDDNDAKNTVATLTEAGMYTFVVTVSNTDNQSITSTKLITVAQKASDVSVTPNNPSVVCGSAQQFTATVIDQFGDAMPTQPASYAWRISSANVWNATGTIGTTNGLYSAPTYGAGTVTITATG